MSETFIPDEGRYSIVDVELSAEIAWAEDFGGAACGLRTIIGEDGPRKLRVYDLRGRDVTIPVLQEAVQQVQSELAETAAEVAA